MPDEGTRMIDKWNTLKKLVLDLRSTNVLMGKGDVIDGAIISLDTIIRAMAELEALEEAERCTT